MKTKIHLENDMLPEYDLNYRKAKQNRFAKEYHITVTLDSDVAGVFKNSKSVNDALRTFIASAAGIEVDRNAQSQ